MTIDRTILATLLLLGLPTIAVAQLVAPAGKQAETVCPVRPDDPAIIENMSIREGHLTLLLKEMYKAMAYQDIATSGTCRCDQRFPSWEPVVTYYLKHYAGDNDHNSVRERRTYYRDAAQSNRPAVREICIADGNW